MKFNIIKPWLGLLLVFLWECSSNETSVQHTLDTEDSFDSSFSSEENAVLDDDLTSSANNENSSSSNFQGLISQKGNESSSSAVNYITSSVEPSSSNMQSQLEILDTLSTQYELGDCTLQRDGLVYLVQTDMLKYLCSDRKWVSFASDSFVKSIYNLGVCNRSLSGKTSFVLDEKKEYSCLAGTWMGCKNDGSLYHGVEDTNYYVCDLGTIRVANEFEVIAQKGCIEGMKKFNIKKGYSFYVCENGNWKYDFQNLYRDSLTYSGNKYKLIGIGDQLWMAENLKETPSSKSKWYYSGKDTYGGLYPWSSAMNISSLYDTTNSSMVVRSPHKGLCPTGFHIPTKSEFQELIDFVERYKTSEKIANAMLANGNNEFGFSLLLAGDYSVLHGYLHERGTSAGLWSSTEFYDSHWKRKYAYVLHASKNTFVLRTDTRVMESIDYWKTEYRSVRCLKN